MLRDALKLKRGRCVFRHGLETLDFAALHMGFVDAPVGGIHDDAVIEYGLSRAEGPGEGKVGRARKRLAHRDAAPEDAPAARLSGGSG